MPESTLILGPEAYCLPLSINTSSQQSFFQQLYGPDNKQFQQQTFLVLEKFGELVPNLSLDELTLYKNNIFTDTYYKDKNTENVYYQNVKLKLEELYYYWYQYRNQNFLKKIDSALQQKTTELPISIEQAQESVKATLEICARYGLHTEATRLTESASAFTLTQFIALSKVIEQQKHEESIIKKELEKFFEDLNHCATGSINNLNSEVAYRIGCHFLEERLNQMRQKLINQQACKVVTSLELDEELETHAEFLLARHAEAKGFEVQQKQIQKMSDQFEKMLSEFDIQYREESYQEVLSRYHWSYIIEELIGEFTSSLELLLCTYDLSFSIPIQAEQLTVGLTGQFKNLLLSFYPTTQAKELAKLEKDFLKEFLIKTDHNTYIIDLAKLNMHLIQHFANFLLVSKQSFPSYQISTRAILHTVPGLIKYWAIEIGGNFCSITDWANNLNLFTDEENQQICSQISLAHQEYPDLYFGLPHQQLFFFLLIARPTFRELINFFEAAQLSMDPNRDNTQFIIVLSSLANIISTAPEYIAGLISIFYQYPTLANGIHIDLLQTYFNLNGQNITLMEILCGSKKGLQLLFIWFKENNGLTENFSIPFSSDSSFLTNLVLDTDDGLPVLNAILEKSPKYVRQIPPSLFFDGYKGAVPALISLANSNEYATIFAAIEKNIDHFITAINPEKIFTYIKVNDTFTSIFSALSREITSVSLLHTILAQSNFLANFDDKYLFFEFTTRENVFYRLSLHPTWGHSILDLLWKNCPQLSTRIEPDDLIGLFQSFAPAIYSLAATDVGRRILLSIIQNMKDSELNIIFPTLFNFHVHHAHAFFWLLQDDIGFEIINTFFTRIPALFQKTDLNELCRVVTFGTHANQSALLYLLSWKDGKGIELLKKILAKQNWEKINLKIIEQCLFRRIGLVSSLQYLCHPAHKLELLKILLEKIPALRAKIALNLLNNKFYLSAFLSLLLVNDLSILLDLIKEVNWNNINSENLLWQLTRNVLINNYETTPLYLLIYKKQAGIECLNLLFKNCPPLLKNLSMQHLCTMVEKLDGTGTDSPFYKLCSVSAGKKLLLSMCTEMVFNINDADIVLTELVKTKDTVDGRVNALFWLCNTTKDENGQNVLKILLDKFPNLAGKISIKDLCLNPNQGLYQDRSPMFYLAGTIIGRNILSSIIQPNDWSQCDVELFLSCLIQQRDNLSVLSLLCQHDDGLDILDNIIKQKPALEKPILNAIEQLETAFEHNRYLFILNRLFPEKSLPLNPVSNQSASLFGKRNRDQIKPKDLSQSDFISNPYSDSTEQLEFKRETDSPEAKRSKLS